VADDRCRNADRISLTSLPFFFEGTDVKIADGFATPVQDTEPPRKLLSGGHNRAEREHPRDIVEITFVCKFHSPNN
jgi:hypothetical protein